jgi:hypothetical protein
MSAIARYRTLFAGRIIRRCSTSKDNLGDSVMVDLPALANIVVPVVLPAREEEEMHRRASELKQRSATATSPLFRTNSTLQIHL